MDFWPGSPTSGVEKRISGFFRATVVETRNPLFYTREKTFKAFYFTYLQRTSSCLYRRFTHPALPHKIYNSYPCCKKKKLPRPEDCAAHFFYVQNATYGTVPLLGGLGNWELHWEPTVWREGSGSLSAPQERPKISPLGTLLGHRERSQGTATPPSGG
jgi:hypothetical protein